MFDRSDGRSPPVRGRHSIASNAAAIAWKAVRWRSLRGGWFLDQLRHHRPFNPQAIDGNVPIDVIVTIVDHYEPAMRFGEEYALNQVSTWCEAHRKVAERHRDADGRPPQHTWFYRSEYRNERCLQSLSSYAFDGYGEVEFHLHHGFDSHDTFAARLDEGLNWFNQFGAMLTAEPTPRRRFGYIAGNWSLDNGTRDDSKSGCNTELIVLRDAGCYADFTFPALGSPAQPRKTNSLYYATDDPGPKSYDRGVEVAVGTPASGDLLIFQGPLVVDWTAGRIEGAALETFAPPSSDRLGAWLKANVHVKGRPEWIFVKLHTHGMQSREALLSPALDSMFEAMERSWNQGRFRLHYATAREAYNIAKAAESGCSGNPNDYRDFDIARPGNREVRCSAPWRLLTFGPDRISLKVHHTGPASIELARGPLRSIRGTFGRLDVDYHDGRLARLEIECDEGVPIETIPRSAATLLSRRAMARGDGHLFGMTPQPVRSNDMVEWAADRAVNVRPQNPIFETVSGEQ